MSQVISIKMPINNPIDKDKLKVKAESKGFKNTNSYLVSIILKLAK